MSQPAPTAPFEEKLAYYRSIHSTRGVKVTHFVGLPTVVASLPLLFVRPRVGIAMFVAGWGLNLAGHALFQKQSPALRHGPLTYQLTGVAEWAAQAGELLSGLARWRAGRAR